MRPAVPTRRSPTTPGACRSCSPNAQGIEPVAHERQIVQPVREFAVGPGSLREPGAEEVVGHAPVGRREERERVDQRAGAWHAGVAAGNRQGIIESPADVAGDNDRSGPGGGPDGEAVPCPLVENVAAQDKHRAIDGDVVAPVNLAGHAQVVGVRVVAVEGVEIAELSIDVELQQERQRSVRRGLPDDDAIPVAIAAGCL
jgi:hypothetical protein